MTYAEPPVNDEHLPTLREAAAVMKATDAYAKGLGLERLLAEELPEMMKQLSTSLAKVQAVTR